jgi:hypothetical protein
LTIGSPWRDIHGNDLREPRAKAWARQGRASA